MTPRYDCSPIRGRHRVECSAKRLRVNVESWSLLRVYHNPLLGAQRGPHRDMNSVAFPALLSQIR